MNTTTLAPELNVSDRCDRCGAQAYMKATIGEGLELLFCAHHGRKHLEKLQDLDEVRIVDETHRLHEGESTPETMSAD